MKKNIHPAYNQDFSLKCSTCDFVHKFGSVATKASLDVCSNCHPFYTGDRSQARATGRVERFQRRLRKKTT